MADSENQSLQQSVVYVQGEDHPLTEEELKERYGHARIIVFGVGGGGCNALNRMIEDGIDKVEFVAVNTDASALASSKAHTKILLGTSGLGAGGDPEVGAQAARDSESSIAAVCKGADMVFVAAGMGGGTGTGAAPVVARIAKESGALTVAVVTKPFETEGPERTKRAVIGLKNLRESVDSFIVISNNELLIHHREETTDSAFRDCDAVLSSAVQTIVSLIYKQGHINLDFADIKSVLKDSGLAVIGFASAKGKSMATGAASAAINAPLLESSSTGYTRVLVNVTHSPDTTLGELMDAVKTITNRAKNAATVMVGDVPDPSLTNEMKVSVICTAFDPKDQEALAESKDGTLPKKRTPTPADVMPAFLTNLLVGNTEAPIQPEILERDVDSAKLQQANAKIRELTEANARLSKSQQTLQDMQSKVDSALSQASEAQQKYLAIFKEKSELERQVSESQGKVTQREAEVNALQEQLTQAQSQLAEAERARDEAQAELAREKIDALSQSKALQQELNDRISQESVKADQASLKLTEVQAELERLKGENQSLRDQGDKYRTTISELNESIDRLNGELKSSKDQADDLTRSSSQASADLESEKADIRRLTDELEHEKQSSLKDSARTQEQIDDLTAEVVRLKAEKDEALKSQAEEYGSRISAMSQEFDDTESAYKEQIQSLKDENLKIEVLAKKLENSEHRNLLISGELARTQIALGSTERRLESADLLRLSQEADREALEAELKDALLRCDSTQEELGRLRSELDEGNKATEGRAAEIGAAQRAAALASGFASRVLIALGSTERRMKSLEAQIEGLKSAGSQFSDTSKDLEKAWKESAENLNRIHELEIQLEESIKQSQESSGAASRAQMTLASTKRRLEEVERIASDQTQRAESYQARLKLAFLEENRLREKIQDSPLPVSQTEETQAALLEKANSEIDSLKSELLDAQTERDQRASESRELRDRLASKEQELNGTAEKLETAQKDLEAANQSLKQVQDEKQELETKFESLQNQSQGDSESLTSALSQRDEALSRISELQNRLDEHCKAEDDLKSQLDSQDQQVASLQNSLDEITKDRDSLSEQLDLTTQARDMGMNRASELQVQLDAKVKEAEDLKASLDQASAERDDANERVDHLVQIKEQSLARVHELQEQLDASKQAEADLKSQIEVGESNLEASKQRIQELENQLAEARAQVVKPEESEVESEPEAEETQPQAEDSAQADAPATLESKEPVQAEEPVPSAVESAPENSSREEKVRSDDESDRLADGLLSLLGKED